MKNVWDHDVPVEKSSYLCGDSVEFFNVDNFKHDKNISDGDNYCNISDGYLDIDDTN